MGARRIWKHLRSCLADDVGCQLRPQRGCRQEHFLSPRGPSTWDGLGFFTVRELSSENEHPVKARQKYVAFLRPSLRSHITMVLPYCFGQGNHKGHPGSGNIDPTSQGERCQGQIGGGAPGQEILMQPALENALSYTFCI